MLEPCQIYLLTPPVIDDVEAFCETLKTTLAAAPVACLQIRLKDLDDSALVQAGRAITATCHAAGVEVILNDRPDLVADIGADGAHIGQDDMDYFSSREVLGGDAIIGVTCHNSKELAFAAASAGADYVGFGAFFETPTKTPKARAELEILSWWQEAVEIPCVAIGGITVDNAARGFHRRLLRGVGPSRRAIGGGVAALALMFAGSFGLSSTAYAAPTLSSPVEASANFEAAQSAYQSGNKVEALRLARIAGQSGSSEAAVMAGHILRHGEAVTVDLPKAKDWYVMAAMKGHPDALVALGQMGLAGEAGLTATDAVSYFTRAADNGRTDAMRALAELYRTGTGVKADAERSQALLRQAAQSFDPDASKALGDQLLESDPQAALAAYETAAAAGNADAAYAAGVMYAENFETRPDSRKSARWLQQAALAGHAAAQADYGLLVYQGIGTTASQAEAAEWFRKSAQGGDAEGQFLYAFTLAKGEGLTQDFGEAYYWVLRSIQTAGAQSNDLYDKDRMVLRDRLEANVDPAVLAAAKAKL